MGAKGGAKGTWKGSSKGPVKPLVVSAFVKKTFLKGEQSGPIKAWSSKVAEGGKGASKSKGVSAGKGAVTSYSSFSSKGATKGARKGATEVFETKGKGKGKSKTKDKGKGKGKFKTAAPKNAQFWVRKAEAENRTVLDGQVLTGTCERYNWKQGWGFILPDDPQELPGKVKAKLREAVKEAQAAGKETGDANAIYFRKPDVEANFRIKEGSLVTFQLYIDDKGVGACDVCDAGGGEEEEAEA
mmetsp:Transcript_106352/g.297747  ORF Transcript_106352/g.297747 Transcript_106352/m.297747 type:complete len:242 (-) Transcript_106352:38-763(-)|eukprot:CAMPEP_0176210766 /NCGR_PEP_ID=MMETSP0121_2-20121125/14310_1 /TAXON_ID=160619 /ORGANISM="Kryptoperidinium foliaceum, Strain CCMP 1326" /LENGTH=241 /DNA_ID=CAMNT_0017549803 /DNA_START=60 /DNA_END=785 /DNA_ORIENTATION=-